MIKVIVCKKNSRLFDNNNFLEKAFRIVSDEEKERFRLYRNEEDAENYIVGKYLLRTELEKITGIKAEKLSFSNDLYGRPYLMNPIDGKLDFNVSHSNKYVTLAINTNGRIGIDIEKNGLLDLEIMGETLNDKDLDFIGNRGDNKGSLGRFYKLWTLKESFVKALGCGLRYPVKRLSFDFNESGSIHMEGNNDSDKWKFETFEIDGQYQLSVCIQNASAQNDINFIRKFV